MQCHVTLSCHDCYILIVWVFIVLLTLATVVNDQQRATMLSNNKSRMFYYPTTMYGNIYTIVSRILRIDTFCVYQNYLYYDLHEN